MPDLIPVDVAGTLDGLLRERVRRSPDAVAYTEFDHEHGRWADTTWAETADEVARWRAALSGEDLERGDRVAISIRNGRAWVCFDQAALGLGLVVVPIYTRDRPENAAYIIEHSGARLLLIEDEQRWRSIDSVERDLSGLSRIVTMASVSGSDDPRLRPLATWLSDDGQAPRVATADGDGDELATIVYTSGTTGRPKGVMLSHRNILSNAWSAAQRIPPRPDDVLLSFLPLSHTYERTAGYYLPIMAGARVAYARSIQDLPDDLTTIRPTVIIAVPRIFERTHREITREIHRRGRPARWLFEQAVRLGTQVFERRHGRSAWRPGELAWPLLERLVGDRVVQRFGGRVRIALSGGAALSPDVARPFLALGLPVVQGYGLTETSPVISVNTPDDNEPESVGRPLEGVEVRLGEDDELEVRGPSVMPGYWRDEDATRDKFRDDGWLRTGDMARIEGGRLYITGRIKQIIVLATGEKMPPGDMERAIRQDPLFEQVMIVGEGRPHFAALAVLDESAWAEAARKRNLPGDLARAAADGSAEKLALERIGEALEDFPSYARVRRVAIVEGPWTVQNGLLTPTLNLRRDEILERHRERVEKLYEAEPVPSGA